MALVYEQLHESENMRMVDLEWYLDALTSTITATALPSDKAIELQVSAAGIQLSAEIITPLGLIVNELVTNSLKHGFKEREKGRVSIAASRREGAIRLIYRDNGCGYPDIQDRSNEHALGMRLIEGLAEQIDAQLSVSGENGFVCTLAFPDQAE
jgi:two-component sensor histidine kinase